MKRRIIYIVLFTIIGLLIIFVAMNKKHFLSIASNYKVYNEKGEALPILIFNRSIIHRYDSEDSPIINEILLYSDLNSNLQNDNSEDDVLSIDIDDSYLYGVNGGGNRFGKIGKWFLFQYDLYIPEEFRSLYLKYDNKNDEPTQFFIAEGNTYKFNTFGGLRALGDTIIVEKLDGPIEKERSYIADE